MHLFAGIGGGLLADLILGHDPIIAVEWDGYASQVLRERASEGWFPNLSVWEGDVRLFDPSEYKGRVDCIHAGFPCQDISVAGNQKGVGHETRSGLYREVLRIAGIVRPRYLFLENVSAILGNGLGTVLADLAAMGFSAEWGCIRASDVGAPHHRDRWFCLAYTQGQRDSGRAEYGGCLTDKESTRELGGGCLCKDVPYTNGEGLQGRRSAILPEWGTSAGHDRALTWWGSEPDICRVANGVPNRVHRLKGLGNAQVPLQAAVAFKLLGGE